MQKILFLFLLMPLFINAQDKMLFTEGVSPGMYIIHKVAPKENYYSIGRIYNVSPKEIAPFNNLQLESGLNPGQQIKIPLNSNNFFQNGNAAADETFVPVYYAVKEKEGLYRVAKNHHDLPLETLKQWNNIKADAVKNGTRLIVGYLKVKTELSVLSKNGIGQTIHSNAVAVVKSEEVKAPIPVKTVTDPEGGKAAIVKKETIVAVPVTKTVVETKNTGAEKINNTGSSFKSIYESQIRNSPAVSTEGMAGVFKSTSGWQDKKYYCLYNSAAPGTIIKITNPANQKSVFAKVLDLMPDLKQNEGLLLLISNAAADELGAAAGNFACAVSYSK